MKIKPIYLFLIAISSVLLLLGTRTIKNKKADTIAIVTAMKSERDAVLKYVDKQKILGNMTQGIIGKQKVVVVLAGIGKVAGALATQKAVLENPNIKLIINSGVAGAMHKDLDIYDVVMATEVVYHDVDVTHFGYKLGQLPGQESRFKLKTIEHPKVKKGLIVSGDQFVGPDLASRILNNFPDAMAVEMESGGIAQAAKELGKECVVIRAISDNALKPGNAVEYKTFEAKAAEKSALIIKEMIEKQ